MSHQDRREPLSAEYQYPTHGVDCDCPPCRNRVTAQVDGWTVTAIPAGARVFYDPSTGEGLITQTAYGWGV